MVKVISTNPHESVVKRVICKHCGSTLEYVPVDVQEQTLTSYDGSSDTSKFIICPTCSNRLWVTNND